MNLYEFSQLISGYQQKFIRFADTYVHDKMEAEDIVMEAFMYYWENQERLPEDTNVPAYVLTAVKHKCLDKLRMQRAKQEVSGEPEDLCAWELSSHIATLENFDPHEVFAREVESLVRAALEELPEQTRRIFFMSRYENKSHQEIADLVGITSKGVEFHISKAIKLLRARLKDYLVLLCLYL